MDVKADAGRFDQVEADALVVSVFEGEDPTEGVIGESIRPWKALSRT